MAKCLLLKDTALAVRRDKLWSLMKLSDLTLLNILEEDFQVLCWNGHSIALARSPRLHPVGLVNKTVRIKLDNGDRIVCAPDHHFAIQSNKIDFRVEEITNGLKYVPASKIKAGDRLVSVDDTGIKCDPHNALGLDMPGSVLVQKAKESVSDHWDEILALEIPDGHAFVIACGVFNHSYVPGKN